MKTIFTSIYLLISSLSFAQISILSSDIPRVNDTMRYSETTVGITAAQAAKTGVDTIWDFTNLKPVTQDIEKFYAPTATPYVLQFGLLNAATYGLKDDALNALAGFGSVSGIKIENVYGFYKNTSAANVLMGRGITVSGIPLAINFNPRDTIYKFPLNFGDIDTTYFKGTATIPSVGGISQQGRRVTKVDGWGLIKTPYGQFNCIRIRTNITETDTIEVATFKIPIPNNRTIFTWYAKNEHYPILEITQTTGLAAALTIRYKDINRPEAFYSAAKFNANRTTATVIDTINLTSTSTGSPKSYQWTITPNTVSFVGGTNATTNNPRVIFNATGVYTIKLKVIYEGGQDDTIRSNYVTINPAPVVNFSADKTNASVGENVTFTDNSSATPTTYKWSFTPATVTFVTGTSASKNPVVKFNAAGSYSVSLTASYLTTPVTVTKSGYINVQNVSVADFKNFAKTIEIYPNPVKTNIFIASNYDLSKSDIDMYDILGKKVNVDGINYINKSNIQLNISTLNKGIYFIKIYDENNSHSTHKIIVE